MGSILLVRDGIVSIDKFEGFFRPHLNQNQSIVDVFETTPILRHIDFTMNSIDELYRQNYNILLSLEKNLEKNHDGNGFSCALLGEWQIFIMTRAVTDQHVVRLRWSEEETLLLLVLPLFAQFRRKKRLTWQERKRNKDQALPIKKRKREDKPPSGWSGVRVEKKSRHRSIDGGIVYGFPWPDRRGYKFCPGSFGVQDHCYQKFCHRLVCDLLMADSILTEACLMTLRDLLQLTLTSEVTVNACDAFWEDKSTNNGKSRHIVSAAARGHIGDDVHDYLLRLKDVIVRDYMFQRLIDRVNKVLEFTAYDVGEVSPSSKKPFRGISTVLALSIAPLGSDIHRYVYIIYKQVLFNQRGLEICGLSVRVTLDSKHLIKECPLMVNIDQLRRFFCQKSSTNLSAGELKALPFHVTFVDLMVVDLKGLRKLDDYDSIIGATESGSELWARGSEKTEFCRQIIGQSAALPLFL